MPVHNREERERETENYINFSRKSRTKAIATDLLILKLGQVTRTTPEVAASSPKLPPPPTLGLCASTDLTYIGTLYTADLQWHQDSNPRHAAYEFQLITE
ncbi:hypothetical protein TNCV_4008421 [Trichonephila clavipes]|nr:hypothetical protein TNCV_4008421 [Trichonephila clavipes]